MGCKEDAELSSWLEVLAIVSLASPTLSTILPFLSSLLLLIHLAGIVPVTLPLLSLLHPLVEGSWIAKCIEKQSNDWRNGEKIKIWLFSAGKTGIVNLRLTTSPDIKKHMKLNQNIMFFSVFNKLLVKALYLKPLCSFQYFSLDPNWGRSQFSWTSESQWAQPQRVS